MELLLAPVFIWCLTTPHTKTYIKLDFNAVQSNMYFFSLLLTVFWILFIQIKAEKLYPNFGQTQNSYAPAGM